MDCDLLLGVRHGLFIMVSWLPGCYMDCDLSLGVCVYTAIHMQKATIGHLMTMHVMVSEFMR